MSAVRRADEAAIRELDEAPWRKAHGGGLAEKSG